MGELEAREDTEDAPGEQGGEGVKEDVGKPGGDVIEDVNDEDEEAERGGEGVEAGAQRGEEIGEWECALAGSWSFALKRRPPLR